MKVRLRGSTRGSATLEMLIAFTLLALTLGAVILMSFSNQTIAIDNETNTEAMGLARAQIEEARANAKADYFGVVTSASSTVGNIYSQKLSVTDISPCKKEVISRANWGITQYRLQYTKLITQLLNKEEALLVGGDCDAATPTGGWTNPTSLLSADFQPAGARATDIDVINKMVFISAYDASAPKADIFQFNAKDLSSAALPAPVSIHTGPGINSLDVIEKSDGNYYIFAANKNNTNQFQVIRSPVGTFGPMTLITSRALSGVNPLGSYPQGWRVRYYGDRLYIVTRETAGPELHIFNVEDPTNPVEIAPFELGRTINALVVRQQLVQGELRRVAFLAAADNNDDVVVIDVTDPVDAHTFRYASLDLAGSNDGSSIYVNGSTMYVGKESSGSAPELFLVDVSHIDFSQPNAGMSLVLAKEMGVSINDIQVSGSHGFFATSENNKEFQIWNVGNITNANTITNIAKFNYSQKVVALKYEDNYIFTANESQDALRIIRPAECSDKLDNDGDGKIDVVDPQCYDLSNNYNPEDNSE